jgi:outer membrane protein assembly factor BamB
MGALKRVCIPAAVLLCLVLALAAGCQKKERPPEPGEERERIAEQERAREQERAMPGREEPAEDGVPEVPGEEPAVPAPDAQEPAGQVAVAPTPAEEPEAPGVEGVVIYLAGGVDLNRRGDWIPLDIDDQVRGADQVRTGVDSSCEIQFTDFGMIRISESTLIRVSSLLLSEDENRVGLKLDKGGVLCKVRKLGKNEQFTVATSTSLAGVRGTEFSVTERAGEDTVVAVAEGEVSVVPAAIAERIERIRAGAGTEASRQAVAGLAVPEIVVTADREARLDARQVQEAVARFEAAAPGIEEKIREIDRRARDARQVELAVEQGERVSSRELQELEELNRSIASLQEEVKAASLQQSREIRSRFVEPSGLSPESRDSLQDLDRMKPIEQIASKKREDRGYTRLIVDTDPADALIAVDGKEAGRGRFKGLFDPGVEILLEVTREGYRPEQRRLEIEDRREQRVLVRLRSPVSWRTRLRGGPPVGGAAVLGDRVVLADGEGRLVCLDAGGEPLWSLDTANAPNLNSSPVCMGDSVYFSGAEELVCADASSGSVKVRVDLEERGLSDHLYGRRVAGLGRSLVYPSDQALHLLDAATLEETARISVPESSSGSPAVDGGLVYLVNLKGDLVVIDPSAGRVVRRIPTAAFQAVATAPVMGKGRAVFADHRGALVAVDVQREAVMWHARPFEEGVELFHQVEASPESLFPFAGERFYAVSRESGEVRFGPVQSSCPPLFHQGMLYFCDHTGRFLVMDAGEGRVMKSWRLDSPAVVRPAVFRDRILLATRSGMVYLLDTRYL